MMTQTQDNADFSENFLKIAATFTAAIAFMALYPFFTGSGMISISDFSAFYTAGKMADESLASQAYDLQRFQEFYSQIFPDRPNGYGWFYPPHFLIPHWLMSGLSHSSAKVLWTIVTFAIYLIGMSGIVKHRIEWVFVIFMPACIGNLHAGQTGYLSAGLLALYLTMMSRQSKMMNVGAGTAVGFLTFKPHLWVMLPVLILAKRQWVVFVSATITTVSLIALSIVIFGFEPWRAMLTSVLSGYSNIHDGETELIGKMSTIAALATASGFSSFKIWLQLAVLLLSSCAIFWFVKRNAKAELIAAFAIVASFSIAPHNMLYDHTVLIIPFLFALRYALEKARWALPIIVLVFVWPYVTIAIDAATLFPWSAILILCFGATLFTLAKISLRESTSQLGSL